MQTYSRILSFVVVVTNCAYTPDASATISKDSHVSHREMNLPTTQPNPLDGESPLGLTLGMEAVVERITQGYRDISDIPLRAAHFNQGLRMFPRRAITERYDGGVGQVSDALRPPGGNLAPWLQRCWGASHIGRHVG